MSSYAQESIPTPNPSVKSRTGRGRLALIALALIAAATRSGSASYTEPTDLRSPIPHLGFLYGAVTIGPEIMARKIHFSLYPDVSPAAPRPHRPSMDEELRNVVLYFEPAPALKSGVSREAPARIEQIGETFVPHVLPVVRGATVEFPNRDVIYHNVFSLSRAASFDLGRYPRGDSRVVRFDETGVVKVFCHIHSDMSAVVLVLDNPYFTVPTRDGRYEIQDLPPGDYTVTAWHERARPIRHQVTIRAGQGTEMNFSVPLGDSPLGE